MDLKKYTEEYLHKQNECENLINDWKDELLKALETNRFFKFGDIYCYIDGYTDMAPKDPEVGQVIDMFMFDGFRVYVGENTGNRTMYKDAWLSVTDELVPCTEDEFKTVLNERVKRNFTEFLKKLKNEEHEDLCSDNGYALIHYSMIFNTYTNFFTIENLKLYNDIVDAYNLTIENEDEKD